MNHAGTEPSRATRSLRLRDVPLWIARALVVILPALAVHAARAQPAPDPGSRVALVIGVSAYKHVPTLANPANDARGMAAALRRLGFLVDAVIDPDRGAMEAAVRRLGQRARGAGAAVVFYAGHALEVGGRNWLLPVETNPATERDLRFEALDLEGLFEQLDGAGRVSVVLLDACRDNPFRIRFAAGSRGAAPGGLAPARAAVGTLVAFATAPGTVARDGAGPNSPFTTALLRHIETPGLELRKLMAEVRREVREATRGQQVPWEHSALEGDFYFKPPASVTPSPPQPTPQPAPQPQAPASAVTAARGTAGPDAELLFWQGVRDSTDPADLRAFLSRFPEGMFADLAHSRLARLGTTAPSTAGAAPAAKPTLPLVDALAQALDRTGDRAAAPLSAQWNRTDARAYVTESGHRAIAVEPASGRAFRWPRAPAAAIAEQLALEGCQQAYGAPCVLVALDDDLRTPDPRAGARSPMPRLAYAGAFRTDMVPFTRADALPEAVRTYAGLAAPKALAVRPTGARFMTGTGATPAAAEAAALAACNADGSAYPCFLYASNDRVLLPQRRTEPLPAAVPR